MLKRLKELSSLSKSGVIICVSNDNSVETFATFTLSVRQVYTVRGSKGKGAVVQIQVLPDYGGSPAVQCGR